MNLINKWIPIQSYKHDGSIHRVWKQNFVLENNEDYLIVASKKTKVIEVSGRVWYSREPAVSFFSKKHWFNVIAMFKSEGIAYYCNIASPTLVEDGVARYIDYDLDVKCFPDGTIKILDKNEFVRNSNKMNYPDNLIGVINSQMLKVIEAVETCKYPFDKEEVKRLYDEFVKLSIKDNK